MSEIPDCSAVGWKLTMLSFSGSSISDTFPPFPQSEILQMYFRQLFNITCTALFCISQASVNILING